MISNLQPVCFTLKVVSDFACKECKVQSNTIPYHWSQTIELTHMDITLEESSIIVAQLTNNCSKEYQQSQNLSFQMFCCVTDLIENVQNTVNTIMVVYFVNKM